MKRKEIHDPVLQEEVLAYLVKDSNGFYVDGTAGLGGHAERILQILGERGHLLAIDKDREALKRAQERLSSYQDQVTFAHDDFRHLKKIIMEGSFPSPSGILLDLGISSMQVDTPIRGFSYWQDGPLDMRMDQKQKLEASHLINTASQRDLAFIFKEYGEERWAWRIAEQIVKKREGRPITRTLELVEIIKEAIPARFRRAGPHPARRAFMALRMAVNQELDALKELLKDAAPLLKVGGRLAVISFHSLEDRIVKKTFQDLSKPCICPSDLPVCGCGKEAQVRALTARPIRPGEEEIERNNRSRSAKLRVAEKV